MTKRETEILAKMKPGKWYTARKLYTSSALLNRLWSKKLLIREMMELDGSALDPGLSAKFKLR